MEGIEKWFFPATIPISFFQTILPAVLINLIIPFDDALALPYSNCIEPPFVGLG